MPNLKEINKREGCLWLAQSYFCKTVRKEEKGEEDGGNTSHKLLGRFLSNFVCRVTYMGGIKYVNLIKIGPVVIEIRGVENGKLVVL